MLQIAVAYEMLAERTAGRRGSHEPS